MKRIITKSAKAILASIILMTFNAVFLQSMIAMADLNEVATKSLDIFTNTLKIQTCIQPDPENGKPPSPDKGYIVTIIEEPLSNEEKGKTPTDDFVQRPCYRHVFQYTRGDKDDKVRQTLSELTSTKCNSDLQKLANDNSGDPVKAAYSCKPVQAILSKGGTTMLYGYIGMIYRWGASMVGIIAVLIIVISGIQISAGGGDPEAVTSAKKRIIQSLAGIAVLLLSGLILYTINPDFFVR